MFITQIKVEKNENVIAAWILFASAFSLISSFVLRHASVK
jgi:hypothetical protein